MPVPFSILLIHKKLQSSENINEQVLQHFLNPLYEWDCFVHVIVRMNAPPTPGFQVNLYDRFPSNECPLAVEGRFFAKKSIFQL